MQKITYGRKVFAFDEGGAVLTRTSVTQKALPEEDEKTFTRRLVEQYEGQRGTIEVVLKSGRPDYAIMSFCFSGA